MNSIINELKENILKELCTEGYNQITIIFHNGIWKDIFISDDSEYLNIDEENIENTTFTDILTNFLPFPNYGEIKFDIWLSNKKEVFLFKKIKTKRIHNKI